jgi:hypothetical protein
MNRAESDRVQELCARIAVEQDRRIFLKLVEELNRLLSDRHGQDDEPNSEKKE